MSLYPDTVKTVHFYVLGDHENVRDSYTEVKNKDLFKQSKPIPQGIYDAHMGTTENDWRCHTCFNKKIHCPGHEGHITLNYPVQNPMFKEEIIQWLKIICFECGGLVIDKVGSIAHLQKNKKMSTYVSLIRNINKDILCVKCKAPHPHITRDKNRPVTIWAEYYKGKKIEKRRQLFNHEVAQIFQLISNETVETLGKPPESHPSKFILSIMRVPPNTIRPDIKKIGGGRSNNNDLTTLIKVIVEVNNRLPQIIPKTIDDSLEVNYTNLDMAYHELVKGSPVSSSKNKIITNTNKAPGSIGSRFPQKSGRIRRNLMGTRVWFSARTVITCDPMIRVDELGVPDEVAKNIQIPEVVTVDNKARLMVYFNNKRDTYPGCTALVKNRTGVEYWVGSKNRELVLEEGDTLMRDLIDGDVAVFNRQPTMLSPAMSCHKLVILKRGKTFRLNISACVYYNADFDGDAMNLFIARSPQSRNEIEMLASLGVNFISKVNGSPLPGCFQDTLASIVELTHSNVKISKARAMSICKNVPVKFNKPFYTGREVVSMILPPINFKTTALFYNASYAPYLKYKTEDVEVNIKRGQIKSGILDHKSCGQQRNKSIFHVIHNEYGSQTALDTLFNLQQIGMEFMYHKGFTVAMDDFSISDKSLKQVHEKTSAMITEANHITEKLKKGEIIPPIGMTVRQFYEHLQINALSLGDDFVEPVLSNIKTETSGFYKMISMCKKGKIKNLQAITSAMGSSLIDGKRASTAFGYARTSPYFTRFDTDPLANGFVADSFITGIAPEVFIFAAQEARVSVINKSLSTSIPGQRSRESIKNMESLIANNLRQCSKHQLVVQFIYGSDGVDTRKFEQNTLPIIMIDDAELEDKFRCKLKDLPKKYQNKQVSNILDTEFKQLVNARDMYRKNYIDIECIFTDKMVSNKVIAPFNIERIINNVIYDIDDRDIKELDVVKAYDQVKTFCAEYPYIYLNDHQRKNKGEIPRRYKYAVSVVLSLIRSYLCLKNIIRQNMDNTILTLILDKILLVASKALINYGTAVGSLTSQSLSEPMTQHIIDSHHRAGVSGGQADTQTDTLTRSDELIFAKSTIAMKNPTLTLFVNPEYEDNHIKVTEIANHVESMRLERFLDKLQIFFEKYKNPVHPDFKHEKQMIIDFEKHNPTMKIPTDLTRWVIRLELNKLNMILKNMDLETIIFALVNGFPHLFIVYTPENEENIVIRCYIRNTMFKKEQGIKQSQVEDIKNKIIKMSVRGVPGIEITYVTKKGKSYIDTNGSMKNKNINIITTKGTNFTAIMENPYLDLERCQTDSIKEIEEIFGIEAARHKLRSELERVSSEMGTAMATAHYSLYADELCITGKVRGISKTGLEARESKNVLLRTSYSHMNQVLKAAATNGKKSEIYGMSAPLMLGRAPYVGSTYNEIAVDHDFIKTNTKSIEDLLDEL